MALLLGAQPPKTNFVSLKSNLTTFIRTMTWTKKISHVSQLYKKLCFLKLHDVYKFTHKLFKNELPKLCNYKFTTINKIHDYTTRKPSRSNYFLPRVSKSAGQNKIKLRGTKLWKEISENLKNRPFNSFKKQFKENLLRDYWPHC